mmetsp:Transcript_10773/g.32037  ORF Transcript_10773/g.32037 Transcript_10773/m.32037 type:complete len:211 (+) Transcript_10773:444-1076(+)
MSMSDTREPAPAAALPTGVSTGATRLPSCSISFGSWLCANTNATNAATTRSIVDTQPSSRMSTMMAPALIRWSAVFHLDLTFPYTSLTTGSIFGLSTSYALGSTNAPTSSTSSSVIGATSLTSSDTLHSDSAITRCLCGLLADRCLSCSVASVLMPEPSCSTTAAVQRESSHVAFDCRLGSIAWRRKLSAIWASVRYAMTLSRGMSWPSM